ncbi:MAG: hypothetical protein EBU93_06880 [Chlamydiae bacterium]|nr:hypothetical protein [Chlamydiota bacterium]
MLVFFLLFILFTFQKEQFNLRDLWKAGAGIILSAFTHHSYLIFLPTLLILGIKKINLHNEPSKRLRVQIPWVVLICSISYLTYLMLKDLGLNTNTTLSSVGGHLYHLGKEVGQNPSKVIPTLWALTKSSFGNDTAWLVLALMSLGVFLLIKDRKKDSLLLFFGPIITSVILALMDKYPLTSWRHSIYLVPVSFIPVTWALKWLGEKKRWAPGAIFLVVLTVQLLEDSNRWDISAPRNWAAVEVGPKFSDMIVLKNHLKNLPSNKKIMLDGFFLTSLEMERSLKPKWSIFLDLDKPIVACRFFPGAFLNTPCHCLKDKKGETIEFVLRTNIENWFYRIQKKDPCFSILKKSVINQNLYLLSLKAN